MSPIDGGAIQAGRLVSASPQEVWDTLTRMWAGPGGA